MPNSPERAIPPRSRLPGSTREPSLLLRLRTSSSRLEYAASHPCGSGQTQERGHVQRLGRDQEFLALPPFRRGVT